MEAMPLMMAMEALPDVASFLAPFPIAAFRCAFSCGGLKSEGQLKAAGERAVGEVGAGPHRDTKAYIELGTSHGRTLARARERGCLRTHPPPPPLPPPPKTETHAHAASTCTGIRERTGTHAHPRAHTDMYVELGGGWRDVGGERWREGGLWLFARCEVATSVLELAAGLAFDAFPSVDAGCYVLLIRVSKIGVQWPLYVPYSVRIAIRTGVQLVQVTPLERE